MHTQLIFMGEKNKMTKQKTQENCEELRQKAAFHIIMAGEKAEFRRNRLGEWQCYGDISFNGSLDSDMKYCLKYFICSNPEHFNESERTAIKDLGIDFTYNSLVEVILASPSLKSLAFHKTFKSPLCSERVVTKQALADILQKEFEKFESQERVLREIGTNAEKIYHVLLLNNHYSGLS